MPFIRNACAVSARWLFPGVMSMLLGISLLDTSAVRSQVVKQI